MTNYSINKYLTSALILGLFVPVLFLLQYWYINSQVLGWFLLVVYLFAITYLWQINLSKILNFKRDVFFTYILALLVGLFLWASFSSIFIIFFKLSFIVICAISILLSVLSFSLAVFVTSESIRVHNERSSFLLSHHVVFSRHYGLILFYLLLWSAAAYFLFISGSDKMIFTPWGSINHNFIYTFFIATICLVSLILSRVKTKIVLSCLLAHSVLLHAYIPLAHELSFGSDVWSHIGTEARILAGYPVSPELLNPIQFTELWGIPVPEVFVSLGQFAYGTLWGLVVNISSIVGIELLVVNKWMLPVLWGVALPVIFFQIGLVLFHSVKKSLWLSFFSLVPFSFQALGSLTLPVSLGYLFFFLVFLFWLIYLRDRTFWQRIILLGMTVFMLFGYPLFSLTMVILIISTELWNYFDTLKSALWRISSKAAVLLNLIFIIPAIELFLSFKHISGSIKDNIDLVELISMIVRVLTGWDYSQKLMEQNIRVGNIFFNHTNKDTLISTFFTDFRWQIFLGMVLIWVLFLLGWYVIAKSSKLKEKGVLLFSIFTLGGYVIGWFFLEGNRILSARMNAMVAFSIILVMLYGLWFVLEEISNLVSNTTVQIITFGFLLFFSYFLMTSYLSGPDMTAPDVKQYEVANYITKQDQMFGNNCVISEIWVLLPLEALSKKKITGGGFPVGTRFSQPERKTTLHWLKNKPEKKALENAHIITGSDYCWVVVRDNNISRSVKQKISKLTNSKPKVLFDYLIWRERVEPSS